MVTMPPAGTAPGEAAWRRLHRRARGVSPSRAAAMGPWAVLAPHPDDETLGPGSLLATLARRGVDLSAAFLTDGAGSHRDAPGWTAGAVARARAQEARQALRALGVCAAPLLLGWADAAPAAAGDAAFERTARRLAAWLRARGVRALLTTWGGDPHCDHEAAAAVARAAGRRAGVAVYDYVVWGWTRPDAERRLGAAPLLRLDVRAGRPAQRRAIHRHRSQIAGRITGAAEAFHLPPGMLRLCDRPAILLAPAR